ncbi:hypothetical protein SDC9_85253 [bioreactor metagenome]|uniref:Uncharacterized protein n=1 Tax=bioreactor metagenome TaxID=1076179 RepID=A0A644ZLJ6_9ZZZZ
MTNKGWLLPEMDLAPLIRIFDEPPIFPVDPEICNPETFPTSEFIGLATPPLDFIISSALTSATEYPSDFFSRLIPSAVTTTSCSNSVSGKSVTFTLGRTGTSCVVSPT